MVFSFAFGSLFHIVNGGIFLQPDKIAIRLEDWDHLLPYTGIESFFHQGHQFFHGAVPFTRYGDVR